jgi:hypothetical protein
MIRIYIMIVVVGLVGGAIYGAKYYYDSTQARISQLQENNAKLEIANQTNQDTINKMAQDQVALEAANQQLTANLQEASKYKDELIAKLQKHNLSALSLKKPGLIENRINNGTKEVFDALESLSGRPND